MDLGSAQADNMRYGQAPTRSNGVPGSSQTSSNLDGDQQPCLNDNVVGLDPYLAGFMDGLTAGLASNAGDTNNVVSGDDRELDPVQPDDFSPRSNAVYLPSSSVEHPTRSIRPQFPAFHYDNDTSYSSWDQSFTSDGTMGNSNAMQQMPVPRNPSIDPCNLIQNSDPSRSHADQLPSTEKESSQDSVELTALLNMPSSLETGVVGISRTSQSFTGPGWHHHGLQMPMIDPTHWFQPLCAAPAAHTISEFNTRTRIGPPMTEDCGMRKTGNNVDMGESVVPIRQISSNADPPHLGPPIEAGTHQPQQSARSVPLVSILLPSQYRSSLMHISGGPKNHKARHWGRH